MPGAETASVMSDDDGVISVAELGRRIKSAVEATTGGPWVEGEVAGLRRAASGHAYFTLRDEREDAAIDCVMYRLAALRARRQLVEGARLQLCGRASFWAPRGRLQFVAESARPAGRGALLEALERLKQKLLEEGLFAAARKRPLPSDPCVVGVVTSAHGAAFQDIVTVAFRRGAGRIILSPALVQGEGAALSIVAAIDLLERCGDVEVIIVGRGGGASEDLMAFNDERVVRRIAAASVPVVSAVGHDIDVTLADHAADVRAATPSQAAEIVFPDMRERMAQLSVLGARLASSAHARLRDDRATLLQLRSRLSDPRYLLAERHMLLDDLAVALERGAKRLTTRSRGSHQLLASRLERQNPRAVVAVAGARLGPAEARMRAAMLAQAKDARSALREHAARLQAVSPLAVLARGYAIASDGSGGILRSASEVQVGEEIGVHLHEGALTAQVTARRAPESRGRTSAGRLASVAGESVVVPSPGKESAGDDGPLP